MNIKELLDEKYYKYRQSDYFVETDPIQIPKMFESKEDIEISGFIAASLAWGQRPTIIKKSKRIMELMDYAPYDFIMNATEEEINSIEFVHRTFNSYDCQYFIRSLANIYRNYGGLENIFNQAYNLTDNMVSSLEIWRDKFTELPFENRVLRHIANVRKGSAAKRVNMFLRWMVRKDEGGVDFGIWKNIPLNALLIPLDLHSGNVSRQLGLLTRKQNDIKAVIELTDKLKEFDAEDPIKYDFALFGLGAFERGYSKSKP